MVDYRNCTDDMFNRAMAMKNKDVDKIVNCNLRFHTHISD